MPEKQLAYETIQNKKHLGFVVTAPSWQRVYVDAALAMTDQLVELDLVLERNKKTIQITEMTRERLMVTWLNALLSLFETEKFVAKRIVFNEFDGKKISASLFGESFDPIRHGHPADIKSAYEKIVEMGDSPREENQFFARIVIQS